MRAALCFLLCAAMPAAAALRGGTFDPPREAPDFVLQGSNGAPVRMSDHRGKVVALGFGFTSCPDVCPTTLALLAKARRLLGSPADFQVIYVTIDPERDDPAALRKYLGAFDASFLGATGSAPDLAQVRKAYGIQTRGFHHSSYVYLVDRTGKLRAMIPYGVPVDDIAHDVKALLQR